MCVDELLRAGLEVPELSASLQRQLATLLPDAAARRNPVDLIGSIDAAQYRACLECLLASEEVDAVVAVYVPRILDSGSDVAQSILEACGAAADAGRAKPVVPVIMQSEFSTTWRQSGRQFNSFEFPHIAARALARSVHYAQWKADADLNTAEPLGASAVALQRQFRQATDEAGWLAADEVFGLLKSAGFSVPVWHIATSQAAAVQAAKSLDGPVVLKAVAPELLHKARAGGVQLDLEGAAVVAAAYERLVKRIPHCQAVIVQPFLSGGCELLMGVAWEERFGHLIAFGAGGSQVEAQADVAFRLHPLTRRDAEDLVAETRIGREQLQRLPAAREAVMHLLECLSSLITQLPQIRELDFNPVKVWPDGRICIVDARIRREIALPANENRLLG